MMSLLTTMNESIQSPSSLPMKVLSLDDFEDNDLSAVFMTLRDAAEDALSGQTSETSTPKIHHKLSHPPPSNTPASNTSQSKQMRTSHIRSSSLAEYNHILFEKQEGETVNK